MLDLVFSIRWNIYFFGIYLFLSMLSIPLYNEYRVNFIIYTIMQYYLLCYILVRLTKYILYIFIYIYIYMYNIILQYIFVCLVNISVYACNCLSDGCKVKLPTFLCFLPLSLSLSLFLSSFFSYSLDRNFSQLPCTSFPPNATYFLLLIVHSHPWHNHNPVTYIAVE